MMLKALLDALDKNDTKIRVCRGSVTDYLTELKGVTPRGWPAGSTWDGSPDCSSPRHLATRPRDWRRVAAPSARSSPIQVDP